jgi:peptidoglycan/xylan/chitin deacetylase (PgdA/CDA1 family)
MDKNLIKFYANLIIAFIIVINIFSGLFINSNNTIQYLEIKADNTFEKPPSNKIEIYEDKANVIIMMDDGWLTEYTIGYKYMHKYNMRASIAVIPSLVGREGYMSRTNLEKLYKNNFDLLNHTYDHVNLKEEEYKKQYKEISKAKEWLENNGFVNNSNILIYPHGDYNKNTIRIIKKLNIISGRTIEDGYNSKIPSDLYNIKVKNVTSGLKVEQIYSCIDKAIQDNLTLILLFHKLENVTDDTKMQYPVNDFYQIIDYMNKKKNKINIITYSDWIRVILFKLNKV